MTEIEPARQADMFSGDWVDNRNSVQRRKDRQAGLPQPIEMFSPHDVIYQRVNPRPQMPVPDHIAIPYMWTDPRTPEEIDAETQRAAEKLTVAMFPEVANPPEQVAPAPITDPRRLLAAHSVVPDVRSDVFTIDRLRLEQRAKEKQLYLQLLYL